MARVVWTMKYDLRTLDDTWTWLEDSVPDSDEKFRALGAAALLGVFESGDYDLIQPGIGAFDRAITAFPDDARLPLWRAMLVWMQAYQANDTQGIADGYQLLRDTSQDYAGFTLFGLTMSIAGDRNAHAELFTEGASAYASVGAETLALQFEGAARTPERLGEWDAVRYNQPGTSVLTADMALLAGDLETATGEYG